MRRAAMADKKIMPFKLLVEQLRNEKLLDEKISE